MRWDFLDFGVVVFFFVIFYPFSKWWNNPWWVGQSTLAVSWGWSDHHLLTWCFFTLHHGIHHHYSTPFGRRFFEMNSSLSGPRLKATFRYLSRKIKYQIAPQTLTPSLNQHIHEKTSGLFCQVGFLGLFLFLRVVFKQMAKRLSIYFFGVSPNQSKTRGIVLSPTGHFRSFWDFIGILILVKDQFFWFTLPPTIMEVEKWFSTSMIMGERFKTSILWDMLAPARKRRVSLRVFSCLTVFLSKIPSHYKSSTWL